MQIGLITPRPSLTENPANIHVAACHLAPVSMESILEQKLQVLFPDARQRREAEQELARYGTESYEQEAVRVRLAALKLAGADVQRLHSYVDAAKGDFRDVLAWAEYPAQMKSDSWRLPPHERKPLIAQDRQQYEDWLRQ